VAPRARPDEGAVAERPLVVGPEPADLEAEVRTGAAVGIVELVAVEARASLLVAEAAGQLVLDHDAAERRVARVADLDLVVDPLADLDRVAQRRLLDEEHPASGRAARDDRDVHVHRRAARAVDEARGDGVAALRLHRAVAGHDGDLRRVGGRDRRQDAEDPGVGARLESCEGLVVAGLLRHEVDLRGLDRPGIQVAARSAAFDVERIADRRLDFERAEGEIGEEADRRRAGRGRDGDRVGIGVGRGGVLAGRGEREPADLPWCRRAGDFREDAERDLRTRAQQLGGAAHQCHLAGVADAVRVRIDEDQDGDEVVVVAERVAEGQRDQVVRVAEVGQDVRERDDVAGIGGRRPIVRQVHSDLRQHGGAYHVGADRDARLGERRRGLAWLSIGVPGGGAVWASTASGAHTRSASASHLAPCSRAANCRAARAARQLLSAGGVGMGPSPRR
jgi:hypothetical protein